MLSGGKSEFIHLLSELVEAWRILQKGITTATAPKNELIVDTPTNIMGKEEEEKYEKEEGQGI